MGALSRWGSRQDKESDRIVFTIRREAVSAVATAREGASSPQKARVLSPPPPLRPDLQKLGNASLIDSPLPKTPYPNSGSFKPKTASSISHILRRWTQLMQARAAISSSGNETPEEWFDGQTVDVASMQVALLRSE
ncbi:hypothetical protein ACLMJK_006995 [Lecanora helva]